MIRIRIFQRPVVKFGLYMKIRRRKCIREFELSAEHFFVGHIISIPFITKLSFTKSQIQE